MDHVREHTDDPRETPRPIRPFLPGRVISPGEESDLVTIVQIMLNAVTLVCDRWELLPLSGVYDETTQAAVRGFCRAVAMEEHEETDGAVWDRLAAAYNACVRDTEQ
jgi:hypothetical protein